MKQTDRKRRHLVLAGLAVPVATYAGFEIHQYDVRQRELADTSVIGSGVPVVVQIHDPNCSMCRTLMRRTRQALEPFPHMQYRVADISSTRGKVFQQKYDVPHVTLLFFNGAGKHVSTLQGVTPVDQIRERIDSVLESRG